MNSNYRQELAAQQEQLIDALLELAPSPAEVDAEQIHVCAVSLKNKRARVLNKLSGKGDGDCCGSKNEDMEAYFKQHPGVHPDGGFADLKRYKRFLAIRKLKARFGFL